MNHMASRVPKGVILLLSLALSISQVHCQPLLSGSMFPSSEWAASTPEDQMMNSTRLSEIDQYLNDSQIDSILIVRNGYLVYEEYPSGVYSQTQLHFLASCTKSVISALIGIAIEHGFIAGVDTAVLSFFPDVTIQNVDSRKEALTIEHLLTMTSGFDWDEWTYFYGDPNNTLTQMYESGNPVQFVLDRPMRTNPGEEWVYCSGASHLLSAIITKATGMSAYEFAMEYLFGPIGIDDAYWLIDAQGINLGGGGLSLAPRAMARLGHLYLNYGHWGHEQIVPEEWVRRSGEPLVDLGNYDGYGYQWWSAPALGAVYASGLYGQRICFFQAYNLVVVFTANIEDQSFEIDILTNCIIPAVLNANVMPAFAAPSLVFAVIVLPLLISCGVYRRERTRLSKGGNHHD